jgi:hypothetical protein
MFWAIETSTMAHTENLTNKKKKKKPRRNMDVKQNMNEYSGDKSLTLNDVETPMMENFKHAYVFKT